MTTLSRKMSRDASARVYVGDLGSGGSKPELEREFERYGPLKSVWVARNPPGTYMSNLFSSNSVTIYSTVMYLSSLKPYMLT